jgi:DNA invertase Pin-like site-specific DNA recombinase
MGDVSHIFTLSDDRLYRNLKDHARLMQVAQEHHIKIVVDGKEYDPRNEDDELVLGLNALLAVVDGHRLSKKFGRNKVAAATIARCGST